MKIGTRLVVLLALPMLFILLLFGYLSQKEGQELDELELTRAGRSIARVTQIAMEDYLRDHQLDDARELVDLITGYERVLGFRVFDQSGELIYQSSLPKPPPALDRAILDRVLRSRTATESQTFAGSERLASFVFPLSSSTGEPLGAVQVMERESFIDEATSASRRSIALLTVVMILATGIVLLLVIRMSVAKPIEKLVFSFKEVGEGDLSARVTLHRHDEIGRLAFAFNSMCERLEASQRALFEEQEERRKTEESLRKAERLASVGRLAAGLAHEIGTPLNVIGGRAEALLRRLERDEAAARNLQIIVAQIDRISRIVRSMLDFARSREPRLLPTDVSSVVRRVLDLVEIQIEKRGIRVKLDLSPDLPPAVGDPDQLHQVFLNLATNASDAMRGGGTLSVRTRSAENGFLCVEFEDTGSGIAPENLDRVFDPFFSTKDVGEGTGLGLSVSYGIVREHGGSIDIESQVGRGTLVRVRLKVAAEGSPTPLRAATEVS